MSTRISAIVTACASLIVGSAALGCSAMPDAEESDVAVNGPSASPKVVTPLYPYETIYENKAVSLTGTLACPPSYDSYSISKGYRSCTCKVDTSAPCAGGTLVSSPPASAFTSTWPLVCSLPSQCTVDGWVCRYARRVPGSPY